MVSRRRFVTTSLAGLPVISLAPKVPGFLGLTARAASPEKDGRVLVVIQLDGGNDGINTVVPFRDEGYAKHRQELRLPTDRLLKISEDVGLHPRMSGAAKLLESGRLAIVQGVGYPNPDRSHFASMAIWQTARFDRTEQSGLGWLGRGLDVDSAAAGHSGAIYIGSGAPPVALRGRRSATTSLERLDDLRLDPGVTKQGISSDDRAGGGDLTAFVRRSALDAYSTADRMADLARSSKQDSPYPDTALAQKLSLIAQLYQGRVCGAGFLRGPIWLRHSRLTGAGSWFAAVGALGRLAGFSRRPGAGQAGRSCDGVVFQRVRPAGRRERLSGDRSWHRGPGLPGGAGGQERPGWINAEPVRPGEWRRQDVDRLSPGVCVGAGGVAGRFVRGGAGRRV